MAHQQTFTQAGAIIHKLKTALQHCLPHTPATWLAWSLLPLVIAASWMAIGQASPPAIPAIALATEPLYAAIPIDKPALALALSVEFPTVGAQYPAPTANATTDSTYSNANEYLGYYDAESCYTYNDAPTETPATGLSTSDYKRFDRSGPATNRMCADAFSGNFLNWASSSAIDMLRLALSGGDRYIDTDSLTILQRAVLPNGDPICMWNSTNFPAKQLQKNGDGSHPYWGAVPQSMQTQAGSNDIWVANTLNKIYFGTSKTGGCGNTGAYTLGAAAPTSAIGPITNSSDKGPGGSACADENGYCSFTGVKEVWYGAKTGGDNYWKVAPAYNGVSCSNSVFGDPIPGIKKSCYLKDYTGSWQPPTAGGALNSDGFFYARVQVCNTTSGTLQDVRDYGLCRQYPHGNYKPTGVIQKYSDQMRLAAFGYLMDQTASYNNGRYGGVLRVPMKYVGQKTYNATGQDNTPTGGNTKAEWNPNTGVFYPNPDSDTSVTPNISGVINYLNKFGRTGPTPGVYKKYDPVGELHYEVLRYLQGLQPSPAAISGMTDAMKDGFPVFTTWNDPYGDGRSNTADYSCVKSNIIVIGDIHTHDGNRLPTADAANNIPDINYWRGIVQAFEKNITSTTYVDGQGTTRNVANPNPPNTSVPAGTDTSQIMGSAYWGHTHDIRGTGWTSGVDKQRPGLRIKTFLFDVNEYGAENDANHRRYQNQFFMAAKYGGFESDPSNPQSRPYNTWGNPFKRNDGTNDNDVWQKQSAPGEASTYYLQQNARSVLSAFDEIFSRAATASRTIAGGSVSSAQVSPSNSTTMYSAKFDTSNWSGDVVAEPITAASGTLSISGSTWSAASQLDNMTSPAANRNIFVGNSGATASPTATTFTWDAIETGLKNSLNKTDPSATADSLGQDRLNYLRGDRSKEGNPFRVRSSLLGDIVNSNVVYSGAPSSAYSGTAYTVFKSTHATRTPAVFVGANDGMLHAFNANTGSELFAYIPSWMGPKLSALTNPTYANNHQNYVDGRIAVAEAQTASTGAATDWKTVLIAGTGGGGPGVFALDVTEPSSFSASNVMWEFTRADDTDLGQVVGQPQILKFKTSGNSTTPSYRWFAVFGSGVNNYVPDADGRFSSTGSPALYLLALDKAAGTAWTLGTNYFKISLPLNTSLSATNATGLVNFSPLYGTSGEVTNIYMGDLHGNLWKLNFGNLTPSDWTFGKLSAFNKGTLASPAPYPLYIAKDGSGNIQPISAPPLLITGPLVGGVESFYVLFGTGKYLESSDNTSPLTNSVYAIYDNGATSADSSPVGPSAISGRGRLQPGTVNTSTKTITVAAFKWGRAISDTDTTQRSGWYFDMPNTGEKLISAMDDLGSLQAVFNTIIPGAAGGAAGSCTNTAGSGNQYVVNISNGAGTFVPSTVGMLNPAFFLVNTAETTVSISDSTGRRTRTTIHRGISSGQSGVSTSAPAATTTETIGRLSWRQIYNYQDLKNAP
ncbi:pilus assembly protein [Extensimonas vulgaris]|uniref:Type IV pilus assembly protein PilY1 n=1 Tax=Extensimonas vulgaris TaxID=1031594 RepID=A0A369APY0_9BURK|nr:PilC/PilY family type IV pilus protein [Extensimonas vulgaris]RCX09514.1 type IV pilus assembly protein PilY1 [Extensimonas vulgaris]TWI38644.1 type IV pilus assembly protein PilY1 [Extensimonas vulgaris]TXD14508.1 pilus assembly protein PilY [Extensimonas vulgaris]